MEFNNIGATAGFGLQGRLVTLYGDIAYTYHVE